MHCLHDNRLRVDRVRADFDAVSGGKGLGSSKSVELGSAQCVRICGKPEL